MILKLFALRDRVSGEFFSPSTGFDNKGVVAMYNRMSNNLLKEIYCDDENDEKYAQYISIRGRLLDSQVYLLGEIDLSTGEMVGKLNYISPLLIVEDFKKEKEIDKDA